MYYIHAHEKNEKKTEIIILVRTIRTYTYISVNFKSVCKFYVIVYKKEKKKVCIYLNVHVSN